MNETGAYPELLELLGLGDPASFDVDAAWAPRRLVEQFVVPIGVDDHGRPVTLDIKGDEYNGMGPHGLLVGAAGSGKSELLRTIVLALAATHPPDVLNFVLVDFEDGATFHGLSELPHVSAVLTNLRNDLTLADRLRDAVARDSRRRQDVLHRAGRYTRRVHYEQARSDGASLEPLPALLVVVDEFSELLAAKPEFVEVFVQIGRIGRYVGIHQLLSSRRLEEGRRSGFDSHLSYRIGLRASSADESRAVLGVPDAYELPLAPGTGYLRGSFAEPPQRFSACFVAPTVLDVVVGRLRGKGRPAHRLWPPA